MLYGGNLPLAVAARYGKLDVVGLLVHRGAKVNAKGVWGRTALHWAAEGGHHAIIGFLLSKKARAHVSDNHGYTALMLGCTGGHVSAVRMLVHHRGAQRHGAGIVAATIALRWAAREGLTESTKILLSVGAQAGRQDSNTKTVLMEACEIGHLGVVQTLVKHLKAQGLNERDWRGLTALYYATQGGHEDVVGLLLSKGAQANIADYDKRTPLMVASEQGHVDVVRMLVHSLGLQALEAKDQKGQTALYHAAIQGHEEIVEVLLAKGAQANSSDNQGRTPFVEAAKNGHLGVIQTLAQHMGLEGLNEKDRKGQTALFCAARTGHEEVVAFLLSKRAHATDRDLEVEAALTEATSNGHVGVLRVLMYHMGEQVLNTRHDVGRTLLHLGASCGREEVVRFLLVAGADPTIKDNKGRTPRRLAVKKGRWECVAAFQVAITRVQSASSPSNDITIDHILP